jgi:hypothetical protein
VDHFKGKSINSYIEILTKRSPKSSKQVSEYLLRIAEGDITKLGNLEISIEGLALIEFENHR